MPRFVRDYINVDVVEEAKHRIRRSYEEFDYVSVSFSGGKDSLAMLHLVREVAIDEGYSNGEPVHVLFLDEEVIHKNVLDFVAAWRNEDWIDLRWWCAPLQSHKYILGVISDYVQWDPKRDPANGGVGWVWDKPSWGLDIDDLYDPIAAWQRAQGLVVDPHSWVGSQYMASEVEAMRVKGRYMQLCGMRTSESLLRYAMISSAGNTPSQCWFGMPTLGRVYLGKPIYDMAENDVFKVIMDRWEAGRCPAETPYAPIYDGQLWTNGGFRVGTALTSEAAGRLPLLRASDPELYDRITHIFPEMAAHERYHSEFDPLEHMAATGELERITLEGVREWVDLELDGKWRRNAIKMIAAAERYPAKYPPPYLMRGFMNGAYKRGYLAADPKSPNPYEQEVPA